MRFGVSVVTGEVLRNDRRDTTRYFFNSKTRVRPILLETQLNTTFNTKKRVAMLRCNCILSTVVKESVL